MSEKLYQAMGDISEKHILEAEQYELAVQDGSGAQRNQNTVKVSGGELSKDLLQRVFGKWNWKNWGVVAACLALVIAIGALGRFSLGESLLGTSHTTVIGGVERHYKKDGVTGTEISIIWPEEYLTIYEKYSSMIFKGRGYRTRANAIGAELLGEVLGTCTAQGYDIYTETTFTESFEVRRILGVAPEVLVAVGMEDQFYVYMQDEYAPPQTLGQMIEMGDLVETLSLQRFSVNEGHTGKGYYTIRDDSYIWQILTACGDAAIAGEKESDDWDWGLGERNYLSFTATSEALGIYKKVLYITEDGYVKTNIFEYGYLFDIGEEAAGKIISYAKEHAVEAEMEHYEYRLAGTLTVIEDDYVLIDDSMLCRDPGDGMVFKVPMDDIRIRRCVEFGSLEAGDMVVVSFRGDIDVAAGNVIRGAVSLDKGYLGDGSVYTLE